MPKVKRSNGTSHDVSRSAREGFEEYDELEPEWMIEARKLDPRGSIIPEPRTRVKPKSK